MTSIKATHWAERMKNRVNRERERWANLTCPYYVHTELSPARDEVNQHPSNRASG